MGVHPLTAPTSRLSLITDKPAAADIAVTCTVHCWHAVPWLLVLLRSVLLAGNGTCRSGGLLLCLLPAECAALQQALPQLLSSAVQHAACRVLLGVVLRAGQVLQQLLGCVLCQRRGHVARRAERRVVRVVVLVRGWGGGGGGLVAAALDLLLLLLRLRHFDCLKE